MIGLPESWAQTSVGEVAGLTDGPFGSNLKTSHYVPEGPRVVRLQNIGDGIFRDERAHITSEHFERLRKHEAVPGDVIVASLGESAPRACIIPDGFGLAIVKADCIRLRPADGIEPRFVMWMLNSPPVRKQASTLIKGVGRPRLGLGGIRKLTLPIPPTSEQQRIAATIEEEFSRIDVIEATIEIIVGRFDRGRGRIGVLRRSILEQAFRGQLVSQDPSDEPASELLERIRAGRAAVVTTPRGGGVST